MSVTPTKIGGGFSTASGQTTIVAALTVTAAVGDDVWAFFFFKGSSTAPSVVDSQSNTWTVDAVNTTGTNDRVAICHSKLTTALATTDTITATLTATTTRTASSVCKVAGAKMTSSPLDQSKATDTGATTAVSVGATGTLAQTDELAFTCVGVNEAAAGESITAGGSWAQLDSVEATSGTNQLLGWVAWLETSATTAITGTGTISATPNQWAGVIATYKVASAGVSGTGSGPTTTAGTATGTRSKTGTASGPTATAGSATGTRSKQGTAVGATTTSGHATGSSGTPTPPLFDPAATTSPPTPTLVATAAKYVAGGQSSLTASPNRNVLVGETLLCAVAMGGIRTASITDSQGNLWLQDAAYSVSGGLSIVVLRCQVTHALTPSDVFTVTPSSSAPDVVFEVESWGHVTLTPDLTTDAGGGGPTLTVESGIPNHVNELAILAMGWGSFSATGMTADAQLIGNLDDTSSGGGVHLGWEYEVEGADLNPVTLQPTWPGGAAAILLLTYQFNAVAQWPQVVLECAFLNNPLDAPDTLNWIDCSAYLISFSTGRGRPDQLSSFQTGTMTLLVDNQAGVFDTTYPGSPFYQQAQPRKQIRLRALWQGAYYPIFQGFTQSLSPVYQGSFMEQVTIQCTDAFQPLQLAPYNPNPPGAQSQNPGLYVGTDGKVHRIIQPSLGQVASGAPAQWGDQRIQDVLNQCLTNYPSSLEAAQSHVAADQSLATGQVVSVLGIVQSGSQSGLSMCQNVEVTEGVGAAFYCAKDGTVTFENRYHRSTATRSTVVQATFTDAPAPPQSLAYESITPSNSDAQLWSDALVTDALGTTYQYTSAAAQQAILEAQYQQTTIGDKIWEAYDNAAWAVASTSTPVEWFSLLLRPVFDAADMWPTVLGLEMSDLIEAVKNAASGNVWDEQGFVEGISHSFDGQDWQVTLNVSPVGLTQIDGWQLGASELGVDTVLAF